MRSGGGEDMSPLDEPILFATGNIHKYHEISGILLEYDIAVEREDVKGFEIQSDSLEEIATVSVKQVVSLRGGTAIVEDSGLFIDSLGGFPGPYSSYVFGTLGNSGILRLMKGLDFRTAYFKSVLVYLQQKGQPTSFQGIVLGRISERSFGSGGFGFDPIFIPEEGDGKTFGQMGVEEKNRLSHRSKATRRFAEWYLSSR
jgi:XTP/dITP diphosphohydrolase